MQMNELIIIIFSLHIKTIENFIILIYKEKILPHFHVQDWTSEQSHLFEIVNTGMPWAKTVVFVSELYGTKGFKVKNCCTQMEHKKCIPVVLCIELFFGQRNLFVQASTHICFCSFQQQIQTGWLIFTNQIHVVKYVCITLT